MKSKYEVMKSWRRRRRDLINGLRNAPCSDCRGSFPIVCMDFDHVRGKKSLSISAQAGKANGLNCSLERLMDEIAKCDVVCSNCHRIRTAKRAGRL